MKNVIQLAAILLFGILLTATACNKDKMPDEDKDWNVLEWTVNGERYKAECEGDPLFGCDPVDCRYYSDVGYLSILGSSLKPAAVHLKIFRELKTDGENNLISTNDRLAFSNRSLMQECKSYVVDTLQPYYLRITELDTSNKTITGEFEYTAGSGCQDTLRIEDGYFRLSYRP